MTSKRTALKLALIILLLFGFYLIFTKNGNLLLIRTIIKNTVANKVVWEKSSGSLAGGLTLKNIDIADIAYLPKPNYIKAQEIQVKTPLSPITKLTAGFKNTRIKLPGNEPIILEGSINEGNLNLNVYSQSVNYDEIQQILELFINPTFVNNLNFILSDVDLYITSSIQQPQVKGALVIDNLRYKEFALKDAHIKIELNLKNTRVESLTKLGLYGNIDIEDGLLKGEKTALIKVKRSRISFNGDPLKPYVDISAASTVENTDIDLSVKGGLSDPSINVSSDSLYNKDRLLLMLATNKSWSSADKLINRETGVTTQLAKDFLDYFFLSDEKGKFLNSLGIDNISFSYNDNTKGIKLEKEILDKVDTSYAIEQIDKTKKDQTVQTNQKIAGGYKFTDNLTLEASKELQTTTSIQMGQENTTSTTDDKLMLKYKKSF